MHANGAEEVVYAGELSIRRREENGLLKYVIVLDNNSGTYAPSKEDLPLIREVFARNFASEHIIIEAHDRESPELKAYADALNSKAVDRPSIEYIPDVHQ